MAHAATIGHLADGLITSLTSRKSHDPGFQHIRDNTTKGLRDSSHARTNQFDVDSKLEGLVEKFAVLNRDDLSEALQSRLDELPRTSKWMPELLSLLLLLSNRPSEKTTIEDIDAVLNPEHIIDDPLTWADIIVSDPLDEIGIWDDVERGYHSSGDEATADREGESDDTVSTQATSVDENDPAALARLHIVQPNPNTLKQLKDAHRRTQVESDLISASELICIRQTISMLHGLPTIIFTIHESNGRILLSKKLNLQTASRSVIEDALASCAEIGSSLSLLRTWIRKPEKTVYIQSCKSSVQALVSRFGSCLAAVEQKYISPHSRSLASIIDVRMEAEKLARPFVHLAILIRRLEASSDSNPFALLNGLYENACVAQMSSDDELFQNLVDVFSAGLNTYLKHLSAWIRTGLPGTDDDTSFVSRAAVDCDKGRMWHDYFSMRMKSNMRPLVPCFMESIADQIYALGKSRAFLNALKESDEVDLGETNQPDIALGRDNSVATGFVPFSQVLNEMLHDWLKRTGKDCTPLLLRSILHHKGLLRTIDGLDETFCSGNGSLFQMFGDTLFWRIDHDPKAWANRFLLTELAQNTIGSAGSIDADKLSVELDESKTSRSASVTQQLEKVNLGFVFSWPIQNITSSSSPATYTKIFTLLLQVYRAKYLLRQHVVQIRAFNHNHGPPAIAKAMKLRQSLISFVDALQDYVSTTTRQSNELLRNDMQIADGIDSMAAIWIEHTSKLETSLLLATKLKPVREAVRDLLELPERLSHIWRGLLSDGSSEEGESGKEVQNSAAPEHSEKSDPALRTSVATLQVDYEKSMSFILAGLRGISRAGGDNVVDILAERLQWSRP